MWPSFYVIIILIIFYKLVVFEYFEQKANLKTNLRIDLRTNLRTNSRTNLRINLRTDNILKRRI